MGPGGQCRGAWGPEMRNSIQAIVVLCLCPTLVLSAVSPYQYSSSGQGSRLALCSLLLLPFSSLILFPLTVISPEVQRLTWFMILGYMPLSSLFRLLLTKTWTRPHFPFALIITAPMYVSRLHFPLATQYKFLVYHCLLLFLFFSIPTHNNEHIRKKSTKRAFFCSLNQSILTKCLL